MRKRWQYITKNMFGYKGVWYDQKKDRYFATVYSKDKKRVKSKACLSAKDAAIQYDLLILEYGKPGCALNFPTAMERQVVSKKDKDNLCLSGHDLSILGRSPSGNCRQCSRDASARYKNKKDILTKN